MGTVAADAPDGGVFPYPLHETTLDNGLRTIVVPMDSGGLVAYWTVVRTGSRDEYEPGRTGFAHFFEHMMFRGTEAYSADEYNAVITRMGADANAYTTDDLTAYHLNVSAEDLDTVMEIESDRFRNLAYAVGDFETEAGAVYGEYRKNRTNPFFVLYEAIRAEAYTRHTYGHTTMGYEADIRKMPGMFDYSRSFFSRYYRPENTVLFLVGDLDPAATLERIRHHYGAWERGYTAPKIPVEPDQEEERNVSVRYDGRSLPLLWLSYKGRAFDPSDRSWAALSLLAELAFGETSRIHKDLVLDKQWVQFLAADIEMNRDPGAFDVYTRVKKPENVDAVLAAIDATIDRFRREPVTEERLANLKSRLRYSFLMGLDTPDRVAGALARLVAVTGSLSSVDTLYQTFDAVTTEDIRTAAERHLVPARRTVGRLTGAP